MEILRNPFMEVSFVNKSCPRKDWKIFMSVCCWLNGYQNLLAAQIEFQHSKTLQNFSLVSNKVNFIFQTLQCIDFKIKIVWKGEVSNWTNYNFQSLQSLVLKWKYLGKCCQLAKFWFLESVVSYFLQKLHS